ncbi:TonB-dependent receptor [Sphingobium chlorophenolicum L-1]|uniref:TonB-dependent receptor n=1 Tax=Sphingobium chlorophenolicum L-1 TaxID=690566 RepID=F6F2N1_SPHCR|nr:TonB-dependent receptor [Sphingobium chlorophenolicum]AEG50693.1 TonB-dependent receptor [Sphingobium chlorophenolicum L-1]
MVENKNGRRDWLAWARTGTALAPLALAFMPIAARAQSAEQQAAEATTGDIVVTAQRRSESMMSVPVAISAFSGETLANSGIANVQAIQVATPALVINNTGPNVQPFIRGVGSRLLQNGFDPSVATYIDGRYISRQTAISMDLFDVQRVEVLKGPQGVLFGRNAAAGAIRVITNEVSNKAEGMFKVGYGNYNHLSVQPMGNMPITDNFGIRIAGLTDQHDGFATNIDPRGRREWDDKNLSAVRGKARFDNGTVDANLTLSYWRQKDNAGNDTVALGPLQYHTGIVRGGTTGIGLKEVASQVTQAITKREFAGEFNLGVDLDGARLSSITSYASLKNTLSFDGDGTSAVLVDAFIHERAKTFAQEVQITSDNDGLIEWIAGAFFFKDKVGYDIFIDNGVQLFSQGHQFVETTSYAGFGQLGWKMTDHLKLVLGGRYTKDKKSVSLTPSTYMGIPTVSPSNSDETSWSKLTPTATLEYSLADTLLYAKFARGFKSGGYNYPYGGLVPVSPEVLDMYELGLKSSLFNRKVRVTLSGYYYDYKDLQVSRAATEGSAVIITQNAANARLYGVDGDLTWNVTRDLTLAGGFAWQHSEYRGYDLATAKVFRALQPGGSGPGMIDIAYDAEGQKLLRAPKFSAYASVNYAIPVGSAKVPVNIAYSYKGSYEFDFIADPSTSVLRQKAYHLVNGRIGYEPEGGKWSAGFWVNNLFKERYFDDVVASGTGFRGSYGAPRTYGADLTFNF